MEVATFLLNSSILCYSAAAYEMPLVDFGLKSDADLDRFRSRMVHMAKEVWVLQLDGWQDCPSVRRDIAYAKSFNRPIVFVRYDTETRAIAFEHIA